MFALFVPGSPPVTQFPQIAETQWALEVPCPANTRLLTLALLVPLPEGASLAVYWSAPPYEERTLIGLVTNEWPSDTFHTPWSLDASVTARSTIAILLCIEDVRSVYTELALQCTRDGRRQW